MRTKDDKRKEDNDVNTDLINIEILDSILDDDDEKFFQIISQNNNDDLNFNKRFTLTKYKLPRILSDEPTYASLCSFFGAEKCLNSLITLFPDGLQSNFFNEKDKRGRRPIHFACINGNLNILRLFYQEEIDFNSIDSNNLTAAHYAAMSSTNDAIKYLWMKGIDILTQTKKQPMTPLQIACKYGSVEVVKFLCEKVVDDIEKVIDSTSNNYYSIWKKSTPLHLACESGCADVVDYILSNKNFAKIQMKSLNYFSQRPIDCAIQNGSIECVKLLVEKGKDNLFVHNRRHIPLVDAAAAGYADIVSYIIKQKNVELNAADSKKVNAFTAAIINDHLDVVKILIEKGVAKNYSDNELCEAFLKACQLNNMKMVKLLDEKLNIPYQKMGYMFMKQAILIEDEVLILFLIEKKCTFNNIDVFRNFRGKWTPFMTFLKNNGFDFNTCHYIDNTPLIVRSIKNGNLKFIKDLINERIELNADIISDFNCICSVCKIGKIDLFNFLLSYKPDINDVNECFNALIDKYSYELNKKKPNKKLLKDCIKIGESLFNYFEFNLIEDTINNAIYNYSLDFLELFVKHSINLNEIVLNYSRLISSKALLIFVIFENKGYLFDTIKNSNKWSYSCNYRHNGKPLIKYRKNSPVSCNIIQHYRDDYDVNTLIFLIKYAKKEDLIYSSFDSNNFQNVIDVLISFNCFGAILEVYEKLNHILYPKNKTKEEFLKLINESGNNELINVVDSFEEEEVDEDEECNGNNYYSYYYYNNNKNSETLKRLMAKYDDN